MESSCPRRPNEIETCLILNYQPEEYNKSYGMNDSKVALSNDDKLCFMFVTGLIKYDSICLIPKWNSKKKINWYHIIVRQT